MRHHYYHHPYVGSKICVHVLLSDVYVIQTLPQPFLWHDKRICDVKNAHIEKIKSAAGA